MALVGLVLVPTAIAVTVTAILLGRSSANPAGLLAAGVAGMPGELALLLFALVVGGLGATVALLVYLLRPLNEVVESKSRLHDLYRQAREDSLRDALTGLGQPSCLPGGPAPTDGGLRAI